jgi:hypothetical protein
MGMQADIAGKLANLQETQRLRKVQEESEQRKDLLERTKMKASLAEDMIKNPNYDMRLQGYKLKQTLPEGYGNLPPGADPEKLARFTKEELESANDNAVHLILGGENPADPKWGGKFDAVPVAQYTDMISKNPLVATTLLKKPTSTADSLKNMAALLRSLPPDKQTEAVSRALAAIDESAPVNYGNEYKEVGAALSADPKYASLPPFDPKKQQPEWAALIREHVEARRPKSLARLSVELVNETDPAKKKQIQSQIDEVVRNERLVTREKTEGRVEGTPVDQKTSEELRGYETTLATLHEVKDTMTPEMIKKYTGVTRSKYQQGKMAVQDIFQDVPGVSQYIGKPDPNFAKFHVLMGNLMTGIFALGGKQLTALEKRVATMSIPTGDEIGGATEMQAKMDYLEKFINVKKKLTLMLETTPRGKLIPDSEYDQRLVGMMKESGLSVPDKFNTRPWMPSEPPPSFRRGGIQNGR